MLADQEHPLEDAIAEADAGARPDPKVLVVYRTRGVPWLLVPPLLLLAGVAAIVVYQKSVATDRAALLALRESATRHAAADDRVAVDALSELTAATGRAISAPARDAERPRFDPTPAPAPSEPAKPAPAPPAARPETPAAPAPKPEPAPAVVAPAPDRAAEPAAKPAPPLLARPDGPEDGPFDPLVAAGPAAPPIPDPSPPPAEPPPPPTDPPARRDPVGFDPGVRPAVLDDAEPKAIAPLPGAGPPANPEPVPVAPPAAEQPFELDRRTPVVGADVRRAERTQQVEEDIQLEAERRLAERARLLAIKADQASPDPIDLIRNREKFKALTRKIAAQQRPEFHEELKRLIREQGRAAGPDIRALYDRFGVDTLPEIMQPANHDLTLFAARAQVSTGERIRRMRQWGLPETIILDDLMDVQRRKIGGPDGGRDEDEAWVYAAWVLLHYPPATPKHDAPAARPR